MLRHAAVSALLALAAACAADSPAAPPSFQQVAPPARTLDTVRGVIALPDSTQDNVTDVLLLTDFGSTIKLVGPMAQSAAESAGRQVWVAGRFIDADELLVTEFDLRDMRVAACAALEHRSAREAIPDCLVTPAGAGLRPNATATWSRRS